jgi:hypothetical protein
MSTMTEPPCIDVATIDRALRHALARGADARYVDTLLDMRHWYAGLEAPA